MVTISTGIEWTDTTWNPVTGCTKVSPGCDRCYAQRIHERFHGRGSFATVTRNEHVLYAPLRWRAPRRVFVNSMSDLFHADVPDAYIAKVWSVMARAPRHTFQLLTKRHARARHLLTDPAFPAAVATAAGWPHLPAWPLPNVWLGVSIEDQHWAGIRLPALAQIPAAVRFVSAEPLLGPIDLDGYLERGQSLLDWVIVGGESGPGARPMHPQWARWLRDQCTTARVAFFFKQWGDWRPAGFGEALYQPGHTLCLSEDGHTDRWTTARARDPIWCYTNEGDGVVMRRAGKHAAGRELDGRTWDQYPTPTTTQATGGPAVPA